MRHPSSPRSQAPRVCGVRIFYVTAVGSDDNDGLTEASSWATTARVNAATLQPGDRILFRAGDTFSGPLVLGPQHCGTQAAPTLVGSYGTGRATLRQEDGSEGAILARDISHVRIAGLQLVGRRLGVRPAPGLWAFTTPAAGGRRQGVTIARLRVEGFGGDGILIGDESGLSASGFEGLHIAGCEVFDCALGGTTGGITVYGRKGLQVNAPSHARLRISNCIAHHNPGMGGIHRHTGSGISLGQCEDSVVENCRAFANGALSESGAEGPVGIWLYDSLQCAICHCTSHHNRTGIGRPDGGGFDLDGGCVDCRIEYCLSHNNDGAGYLLYQYADADIRPLSGNVVRFNISVDDARQPAGGKGSITIGTRDPSRPHARNAIYGNTVFTNGLSRLAVCFAPPDPSSFNDCILANNVLHVSGVGSAFVDAFSGVPAGWRLIGNCYWTREAPRLRWGDTTYGTVAAWRAGTAQETYGAVDTSLTADPLLLRPGTTRASDYKLRPGSPAYGAGLNLALLPGVVAGQIDHFGQRIPHMFGSGFNIGADGSSP